MTTVVWFRQDLRVGDNPALAAAAKRGPVVPLFVLDEDGRRPLGAASRWWLHHSLAALGDSLGGLVLRRGDAAKILPEVAKAAVAKVAATVASEGDASGDPATRVAGPVIAGKAARRAESMALASRAARVTVVIAETAGSAVVAGVVTAAVVASRAPIVAIAGTAARACRARSVAGARSARNTSSARRPDAPTWSRCPCRWDSDRVRWARRGASVPTTKVVDAVAAGGAVAVVVVASAVPVKED